MRIRQLIIFGVVAAMTSVSTIQAQIVPKDAKLEKLFTRSNGLEGGLTEGPAVAPDGSIYFTDITNGTDKSQILRFDPKTQKTTVFSADAKKANGLAFTAHGTLLACEGADHGGRAVVGYDLKTGTRIVIADRFKGSRFNAPNDLCLDVRGRVYFTDPRYLGPEERELPHRAVYRINLDGSVTEVTHDVEKPNGIALSPDLKTLYVADHNNGTDRLLVEKNAKPGAMKIYAFPLNHAGLVEGPKRVLVDYGTEAGCDGMTVDEKGNLYLTSRSLKRPGVQIINPKGKEVGFIATGPENQKAGETPVGLPSNVEFGLGAESNVLYVTIDLSLYRIKLNTRGFAIPFVDPDADLNWRRITLSTRFRSEGVAVGDLNNDGRNDVVAGDVWYKSPKSLTAPWQMLEIREVGNFVAGKGYSNSFANYVHDFDGDGLNDVVIVGFPGDPFHWYRNPGRSNAHWKRFEIWHSICNESPDFVDINGDKKPEFIFGSQPEAKMGFTQIPGKDRVSKKWDFNAVSKKGDPHKNGTFKYYHGLGVGDLNDDGRQDLLIAHGWWEQPAANGTAEWKFHPYALGMDGVNPERLGDIYVEDLDLDGDNDVIGSSAHSHGVWWFENVGGNQAPQFKGHLIDESYSQTHAMEFADVDGDGQRDIITGKRFFAHNGGDPGAREPVQMFWYEVRRTKGKPPEFIRHEIVAGRDTGVGTQFLTVDFDKDGDLDIALSNKKGVHLLIQEERPGTWLHSPQLIKLQPKR